MPFSVYEPDAVRLLSAALSDALEDVRESAGGPLTEIETTDFTKRLADNLMRAFDFGERDPAALKRAALRGILYESHATRQRGRPLWGPPATVERRNSEFGRD